MSWMFDVVCSECDKDFEVDYAQAREDDYRTKCHYCESEFTYEVDEYGGANLMITLMTIKETT